LVGKKCGLTNNIEKYDVKEIPYSPEVKKQVSEIDALNARLSIIASIDNEDLDLHPDIKKMIAVKSLAWAELKIQLNHMNQDNAKEILKTKYE